MVEFRRRNGPHPAVQVPLKTSTHTHLVRRFRFRAESFRKLEFGDDTKRLELVPNHGALNRERQVLKLRTPL